MPGKRSRYHQVHKFYCPRCSRRLWRNGSTKHYLYCEGVQEIQEQFQLSRKNANFLAQQSSVQLIRSAWLEEFFCAVDGKIWLLLTKAEDGTITSTPAQEQHWQRSTHTIDPNKPNPSVSEFSYRMSRKSSRC
ncbi:hypothetical protein [Synechocystis sp. LKSZ1]|uniref:hypothetical protein n=1 Tax=Synechocystis sp. LKSZ1 TaxID=3144951 RepID=UPI00336BCD09